MLFTGRVMALIKRIQIGSLTLGGSGPISQLDLAAGCLGAKGLGQTQAFPESLSVLAQEAMTSTAQRKAL